MSVSHLHTVFLGDDPCDYSSPVCGSAMTDGAGVVSWGPLSIHARDMRSLADRLRLMADKAGEVADRIDAGRGVA